MANETKNPVGEILTWTATIGGVAGLIGMFIPITQDLLRATGLWGWVAFAVLLALLPWIVRFWSKSQVRAVEGDLRKRWEGEQLTLHRNNRDLMLLKEWLAGWHLHDDFHVYLVEQVYFGNLASWFVQQMDDRRRMWERDPRKLENPHLRTKWEGFSQAVVDFTDKINEYMWLESLSKAEREAGYKASLHIPPEWKTRDPSRYQRAVDELSKSRSAVEVSIEELFEAMYSYSGTAGDQPEQGK
ncbi:hypothetical protein DC347_10680 [Pseudarthrobacter sp. AG30]|uniref:hypothetical protein n=1 Tax=Pseudarthrobacter sp. AG30 TaxID=2249742 RepID=UPI000D655410|nr:hypothetical protein [Pseudarthrobacter sp. AG30]RAX16747.1 hypothetical protein DC347_10680 [Pseudarthrobacter sp. AG30]